MSIDPTIRMFLDTVVAGLEAVIAEEESPELVALIRGDSPFAKETADAFGALCVAADAAAYEASGTEDGRRCLIKADKLMSEYSRYMWLRESLRA